MVARTQSQAHPRHGLTPAIQYHHRHSASACVYSSRPLHANSDYRIESGVIYSLYIIIDLLLLYIFSDIVILDAGLVQVVVSLSWLTFSSPSSSLYLTFSQGIIPTLIIVQVGLGRAVRDIGGDDAISRLEANKNALRCSYPDTIPCESVPSRSRDCLCPDHSASSETFVVQHYQMRSETTISSPTSSPL